MFSALKNIKKINTANQTRIGSARPSNTFKSDTSKNSGSPSDMSNALRLSTMQKKHPNMAKSSEA